MYHSATRPHTLIDVVKECHNYTAVFTENRTETIHIRIHLTVTVYNHNVHTYTHTHTHIVAAECTQNNHADNELWKVTRDTTDSYCTAPRNARQLLTDRSRLKRQVSSCELTSVITSSSSTALSSQCTGQTHHIA